MVVAQHSVVEMSDLSTAFDQLKKALADESNGDWQNLHLRVSGGSGSDFVSVEVWGERLETDDELAEEQAKADAIKDRDLAVIAELVAKYDDTVLTSVGISRASLIAEDVGPVRR